MGEFEMQFTLDKIMFNKDNFKIARVYSKSKDVIPYLNPVYRNVSIKGSNMPTLKHGVTYKCTVSNVEESKFGYTLAVENVYPNNFGADDIKTDKDMLSFVEIFIGGGTSDKLSVKGGICQIIKDNNINELTKIKGIGKKTAEKILNVYQKEAIGSKYIIEIKQLGFSDNEINKLKKMYGDNLLIAYEMIQKNIFRLGFRLDRMDNIFLQGLQGSPTDKRRIEAYITKALKDFMYNGYKSYATLGQFYNIDIIQNIEDNVGRDVLNSCIKQLIKDEELKVLDNKYITTFSEWQLEKNVKFIIEDIIEKQDVEKLPIKDIDKEIDEQEENIGFKLNEGQRKAVKDIVMSDKALCMLNGFAGTGKTTVTRVILNIYSKYDVGTFRLCALSGRASSILGESSGYPWYANTIHRTLGMDFGNGGWKYTYDNKYDDTSILVVDEISMIDFYMLYSVLAPTSPNMKVILLGDSGQLPSLSFGKTIETLKLFEKGIQVNELTQIMRQSEDAYILRAANGVRTKVNPFENTKYKWYGEDTEVCIGDSYNYLLSSFIERYKADRDSTIVVTTTKAKTDKLNFDIQELLIDEKIIDSKMPYIIKPSNTKGKMYKMYINDNVMILKNNYGAMDFTDMNFKNFYNEEGELQVKTQPSPLFNGEIYTIVEIENGYVRLRDKYGDKVVEEDVLECCLAYASNCHKLQGSGMNNVFIYHTSDWVDKNMMISSQWLYTAYTRSKKFLSIHTDEYRNISIGVKTDAVDEKVTIIELMMNGTI